MAKEIPAALYTEAQMRFLKDLIAEHAGRVTCHLEKVVIEGHELDYLQVEADTQELKRWIYYELQRFCERQQQVARLVANNSAGLSDAAE